MHDTEHVAFHDDQNSNERAAVPEGRRGLLRWRDRKDRPTGYGIVRRAPRNRTDAPSQILCPWRDGQAHAADVDEPAPGLMRRASIKGTEFDEEADSLGFERRRPDEI